MDERLKTDIQRLAHKRPGLNPLTGAEAPSPILAQTALGRDSASSANSSGIDSPLIETDRTLHATQAISSDGLFVWSVPDTLTMTDAAGRTVEFRYAEP